jgi:predicted short-subunit dehydrogenase-like oxidoreductase (DUF2520 family)
MGSDGDNKMAGVRIMQTLSIIGAGRLGQTLGRLASAEYRVAGVYNRARAHARAAVDFIGAGEPCDRLDALPASDLYLLSVPDDALADCACALARVENLPCGALVFHASGAHDLSVLEGLRQRPLRLGGLHPAYSFADPARAASGFAGTLCALEGEDSVCRELAAFAAALSIASNFLVTLTGLALSVAHQAGIEPGLAQRLIADLMRQTLENALTLGPAHALTGPVVRGDAHTVARHLAALSRAEERAAYLALARATLHLGQDRIPPEKLAALQSLLAGLPGGDE